MLSFASSEVLCVVMLQGVQQPVAQLEEAAASYLQLPAKYSGKELHVPLALSALFPRDCRRPQPCRFLLGGAEISCFATAASRRHKVCLHDGWQAVSEALQLAAGNVLKLCRLAAGGSCFSAEKLSAAAAASEGFVPPIPETERVRQSTSIAVDGTVSWPLAEASLRPAGAWIAPAALQLWGVDAEKPVLLHLPSGAQHERSIWRPAGRGSIKGWTSAAAELQLRAGDVMHIRAVQQEPLQLQLWTDRIGSAAAASGSCAAQQAAHGAGGVPCAEGAAPSGSAALSPPRPPAAPAAAEPAVWQQWVPLGWRGSSFAIPAEQIHLFSAVGARGRRPCTLLLAGGLELKAFCRLTNGRGGRLGEGFEAAGEALQLVAGELLEFRQEAAGSRRFQLQKLPPSAATIPPQHDFLAANRERNSTTDFLADGTAKWAMTASCANTLHITAAALDMWQVLQPTACVLILHGGRRLPATIKRHSSGTSGHMLAWKPVADRLQLQPGDIMHMRASQLEPLELQMHLTQADGSPKPVVAQDGGAEEQQAAESPPPPPAEAATFQVWLPEAWHGNSVKLPDGLDDIFPPIAGPKPRRPCTLICPDGTVAACFYLAGGSNRIAEGFPAVVEALQLARGDLLEFRQEAAGSRRFHLRKLPPSAAAAPALQDPTAAARERNRHVHFLPDGTAQVRLRHDCVGRAWERFCVNSVLRSSGTPAARACTL